MARNNRIIAAVAAAAVIGGCSNNKQADVDLPQPVAADPVVVAEPVGCPTPDASAYDSTYLGNNRSYSIQRGDTLWSLASRYYSNGQRWRDIAAANPGINPRRMRVGQIVVIP